MRRLIIIILLIGGQRAMAQNEPLVYSNYNNPIVLFKDTLYSSKIHEIILHPDSTFEFWSRSHISCLTWQHYKGTWKNEKDTLLFYDNYEIESPDATATYNKDTTKSFRIHFRTDKNSRLTDRKIKVVFIYNFKDKLDDIENTFEISENNTLSIPFEVIPYYNQLASMKLIYQLNGTGKRVCYLTKDKSVNIKEYDIPNLINVEFVEAPKKETIYRITKAIKQNNKIVIFSTDKTNATFPDFNKDIDFEKDYTLKK